MCPHCESPLTGSASRGRTGKHYPAYHCSNKRKGKHYFRVSKDELEELVDEFIGNLKISPKRVDQVMGVIDESLGRAEAVYDQQIAALDQRAVGLRAEIQTGLGKLRILNSASTIKYLDSDIERLEGEIAKVEQQKQALEVKKPRDMKQMRAKLNHLLEHFGRTLKNQSDPAQKARLFGLLFDKLPTYNDLVVGTRVGSAFPGVNPIFRPDSVEAFNLARETGFEPSPSILIGYLSARASLRRPPRCEADRIS